MYGLNRKSCAQPLAYYCNRGNNHTSLEKCIFIVFVIFVLESVM